VLERKWTSIARLKKQVMDLERQCKQLKETNEAYQIDMQNMEKSFKENGGKLPPKETNGVLEFGGPAENSGDAIPREPEKLKLKGHRARITKV